MLRVFLGVPRKGEPGNRNSKLVTSPQSSIRQLADQSIVYNLLIPPVVRRVRPAVDGLQFDQC